MRWNRVFTPLALCALTVACGDAAVEQEQPPAGRAAGTPGAAAAAAVLPVPDQAPAESATPPEPPATPTAGPSEPAGAPEPAAAEALMAALADPRVPERLPRAAEVSARAGLIPNGEFAPDFDLPRVDAAGGRWRLSAHVGPTLEGDADAALVCFMASWCGYCHRSLPTLKALAEEHGDRLRIVIITTDQTDEAARREAERVAAAGLDVPVLKADAATLSAWLGRDRGVPRYFFVNKVGEVTVRDRGFGSSVAQAMPKQARFTLQNPGYVER